jgi:hypothetical protein
VFITGLGNDTKEYQRSCLWNTGADRFCPVFRIEDMLAQAGIVSFEEDAMPLGALITVQIKYTCDLDKNKDTCEPEYEFTRVDKKDDPVREQSMDAVPSALNDRQFVPPAIPRLQFSVCNLRHCP